MADIYTDTLLDYLRGEEWQQSIEIFIDANCSRFDTMDDFSHDHHNLWKVGPLLTSTSEMITSFLLQE